MAKKIIFNADDFGPSASINKGIYEGIKAGIVSSVSVFVTFGETNFDNITNLKKFIDSDEVKHHVGIGLHFTVTAGHPVYNTRYNSLTKPSGLFATSSEFRWRVNPGEFEDEMDAQINKLAELLGSYDQIDHINCHVGICFMKDEFWKILISKGYPVRSPIKFSSHHDFSDDKIPLSPITRIALRRFFSRDIFRRNIGQRLRYAAINNGYRFRKDRYNYALNKGVKIPNSTLFGYYKQASVIALNNVVVQLVNGTSPDEVIEVMLHLCSDDNPSDKFDFSGIESSSFYGRKKELDCLIESKILNLMEENDIKQVSYSQI